MTKRFKALAATGRSLGLVLGLVLVLALPGMASAATSELNFTVVRNGDDIGWQKIAINRSGENTVVTLKSGISVKVMFFEAYRFDQDSTEVYKGGQLVKVVSKTHDDGPDYVLDVRAQGGALVAKATKSVNSVAQGETNTSHPAGLVSGSLWNKDVVTQTRLLNTIDGSIIKILNTKTIGTEPLSVKGQTVSATHYVLTGTQHKDGETTPWERQVWFDTNGNLVQYELTGGDGSSILYVMR